MVQVFSMESSFDCDVCGSLIRVRDLQVIATPVSVICPVCGAEYTITERNPESDVDVFCKHRNSPKVDDKYICSKCSYKTVNKTSEHGYRCRLKSAQNTKNNTPTYCCDISYIKDTEERFKRYLRKTADLNLLVLTKTKHEFNVIFSTFSVILKPGKLNYYIDTYITRLEVTDLQDTYISFSIKLKPDSIYIYVDLLSEVPIGDNVIYASNYINNLEDIMMIIRTYYK